MVNPQDESPDEAPPVKKETKQVINMLKISSRLTNKKVKSPAQKEKAAFSFANFMDDMDEDHKDQDDHEEEA